MRLGVTGGSGGGLLTNWIDRPHRSGSTAAVSQRSIADWEAWWYARRLHAVSAKLVPPGALAGSAPTTWRGPRSRTDDIHTPLMLVDGDADYRTPPTAGGEPMFRALKLRHVPVVMVRVPSERPRAVAVGPVRGTGVDRLRHIANWFDKWLQGEVAARVRRAVMWHDCVLSIMLRRPPYRGPRTGFRRELVPAQQGNVLTTASAMQPRRDRAIGSNGWPACWPSRSPYPLWQSRRWATTSAISPCCYDMATRPLPGALAAMFAGGPRPGRTGRRRRRLPSANPAPTPDLAPPLPAGGRGRRRRSGIWFCRAAGPLRSGNSATPPRLYLLHATHCSSDRRRDGRLTFESLTVSPRLHSQGAASVTPGRRVLLGSQHTARCVLARRWRSHASCCTRVVRHALVRGAPPSLSAPSGQRRSPRRRCTWSDAVAWARDLHHPVAGVRCCRAGSPPRSRSARKMAASLMHRRWWTRRSGSGR